LISLVVFTFDDLGPVSWQAKSTLELRQHILKPGSTFPAPTALPN
jgi:hypothetical protein